MVRNWMGLPVGAGISWQVSSKWICKLCPNLCTNLHYACWYLMEIKTLQIEMGVVNLVLMTSEWCLFWSQRSNQMNSYFTIGDWGGEGVFAPEGAETKDMNSCWTIGDSPGCGEGVFATRTIKAGEEVGFAKSIPAKNEIWQRDGYYWKNALFLFLLRSVQKCGGRCW